MSPRINNDGEKGPPLLMLPGWGMHGGIWKELAAQLATAGVRALPADLPDHGHSPATAGSHDLDHLTAACLPLLEDGAVVLGWSLGGIVAMELARRHPQRVRALVLVASTPRFTRDPQWPHGLAPRLLADFADALQKDARRTLQRFLALQVRGERAPRPVLRRLQAIFDAAPPPRPAALAGGLDILRRGDLRQGLADIHCPTLILHGAGDEVVPLAAGRALRERLPDATLQVFPESGHAPFISRQGDFYNHLLRFCHEHAG